MQGSPILSISPSFNCYCSMCSSSDFAEFSAVFSEDFNGKLKLDVSDNQFTKSGEEESLDDRIHDEKQQRDETLEDEEGEEFEEKEEDDDDDNDEFEFSFVRTDTDGLPISAEDFFSNGEIRQMFPLFNRDLLFAGGEYGDSTDSSSASSRRPPLRKVFVEERDLPSVSCEEKPVGEYCRWTGKAVEVSPEVCKKSNSTGFCKRWRFRDLLHRSSSDGTDAFVFLHHSTSKDKKTNHNDEKREVSMVKRNAGELKTETGIPGAGGKVKAKGRKVRTSAHEEHYARNRATKEGDRRRSYLPYKQNLVGFFTNVNELSRNVHPY